MTLVLHGPLRSVLLMREYKERYETDRSERHLLQRDVGASLIPGSAEVVDCAVTAAMAPMQASDMSW